MDLMKNITYEYDVSDITHEERPNWNSAIKMMTENDLVLFVRRGKVTVIKNRHGHSGVLTPQGVLKTFLLIIRDCVCDATFFNEVLGIELFEAVDKIVKRYQVRRFDDGKH